jgi:hypothetical protein
MKHKAVAFVDAEGTRLAFMSECQGGSTCNMPIYFYDLIHLDTVDPSLEEPAGGWIEITNDDFKDGPDHVGSYALGCADALPSQNYVCYDSWAICLNLHLNLHNGWIHSFWSFPWMVPNTTISLVTGPKMWMESTTGSVIKCN